MSEDDSANKMRGYVSIVIASILWGTMGILARLSYAYGIRPETLIALRLITSFGTLAILLMLLNRGSLRIKKADISFFVVFGIFAVAFQRLSYFYAVELATPTMAAILFYTYPVFVTLSASSLLKEKIAILELSCILMTFLGAAFVVRVYDPTAVSSNLWGILAGLASSLLFVLYFILAKKFRKKYASWTLILYGDAIGALALTPIIPFSMQQILSFPWQLWLLIITIAWIPSLLAYALYSYALKYVKSSRGSALSIAEPLSAALLSWAILRESIEPLQIVGITVALAGIVLLFQTRKTG